MAGEPEPEGETPELLPELPDPSLAYAKSVKSTWERWSSRYRWVDRATEFDEHRDYVRRKAVLEAELQHEATERENRLNESRAARSAGRELLRRFLVLVEAHGLEGLTLTASKVTKTTKDEESGAVVSRQESSTKSIADMLPLALQAIAEGQRLERLELGLATSREETVLSGHVLEKLSAMIQKHVPPDKWDAVLADFDSALRTDAKTEEA